MSDDDKADERDPGRRPSLEAPRLFRRRSAAPAAAAPAEPDEPDEPDDETLTTILKPDEPAADDTFIAPPEPEPAPEPVSTSAAASTRRASPRSHAAAVLSRRPSWQGRSSLDDGRGAVLTGLLTGLVMVGLVELGLKSCEQIRGSNSCGTTPGMLLLIVIFVITVTAGAFGLKACGIPDPGSTSFLAVGLTAVAALLFLIDVLDTWPMIIVIPAITAATMLLSWWVTTTFVDVGPKPEPTETEAEAAVR